MIPFRVNKSFVPYESTSCFPIQNLPYGVFSKRGSDEKRIGVAIGSQILDLSEISRAGLFSEPINRAFQKDTLNDFMALGRPIWQETRAALIELLSADVPTLRDNRNMRDAAFVQQADVNMHLPASIGDYTDFYLSREHATNCGTMLRGAQNALSPNWLSLPVAYHGRSSSIVVSGTPVRRPRGQVLTDVKDSRSAALMPCNVLDFELEMAAFVGTGNQLGESISIEEAEDSIFGLVLLNDWSARDIQKWEMAPLGPFNSKNWASSISPWIVTLDALRPFSCPAPDQDPPVLPYLQAGDRHSYDIHLDVEIVPPEFTGRTVVTQSNFKHLYWTLPQMVAHHTVGGCNLRPGDLVGTGTISCNTEDGQGLGCLLEKTWNGSKSVELSNGEERKYLLDGDTVILRGYCQGDGYRVGFGECSGTVLPCL
ncbi:Fumarylacetoacetase [Coccomyxa subellipsoidea C-169]|uniref:Fumarylacetoacetase n=1 Tax=Coccomyxa subellipsoidea (strain C-169) TaxID=574566 RepID=I0YR51_COCSC|nr:Fumarylacetoacetase [Coccomyxa subellipsoidea C-169]EIE20870.1 Fumarylacetoacetase [Coccomyxa subellipsoidea C-169]|eukprot:XP_005645414.1 Fumarylacetoacetase [Coccomyxa subellipsoidea C-169]